MDTRTLEDQCKISSFNLGIYHASHFENFHLLKAELGHSKRLPNTVILGTNPSMFNHPLSKGIYTPLILPNNIELTLESVEGFDQGFFFKVFQEKQLLTHVFNTVISRNYKPTRDIVNVKNGQLKFYNQIVNAKWDNFQVDETSKFNKNKFYISPNRSSY
jgi:hypothetical protein